MVFSVEIIEKEILASNASVATNAKKRPNHYLRNGRFFKLVEAPPQSPANTKCVLITQSYRLRLRNSLNRFNIKMLASILICSPVFFLELIYFLIYTDNIYFQFFVNLLLGREM